MSNKNNKTLIIILAIIGVVGVCCCGGGALIASQGMPMLKQMNEDYTDQVADFMNRASDGGWQAGSVADQIYAGDGSAQRPEFVQIVFNELAPMGTVTTVNGNMTGLTDNTVNGVRTQTFTWSGTVNLTNGSSPLSIEMIKSGEQWQIKDIYLR